MSSRGADLISEPPSSRVAVDEVVAGIGPRLAAFRADLGLSLQQMSSLADVSAASIHKIERGDMVPTITTLLKLSAAFNRPVTDLIGADDTSNDVWLTPRGTGEVLTSPHLSPAKVVLVSSPNPRFKASALNISLPCGESLDEPAGRTGEGLLHLLTGRLRAEIAGRVFTLNAGDTLHFQREHAAVWHNDGATSAEFLVSRSA